MLLNISNARTNQSQFIQECISELQIIDPNIDHEISLSRIYALIYVRGPVWMFCIKLNAKVIAVRD